MTSASAPDPRGSPDPESDAIMVASDQSDDNQHDVDGDGSSEYDHSELGFNDQWPLVSGQESYLSSMFQAQSNTQLPAVLDTFEAEIPVSDWDWTSSVALQQSQLLLTPDVEEDWQQQLGITSASTMVGDRTDWQIDSTMQIQREKAEPSDKSGQLNVMELIDYDPQIQADAAEKGKRKGSITLTLSQVDPCIAQEIIASVLKHSDDLRIRLDVA